MSSTTGVEAPGDAELISAVRGGDTDAYGLLFQRHVEAARRLARQLVSAGDVEDLVSEAFVKVLQVLQRGGGPDVAFRAYLLTAVRRLRVDRLRATSRLHTTDDMEMFDPGVPFRDTAVEGFESATAAKAFASLPERWQLVLWHTEVEGQRPADVAPLLGMSANSVSALAYRAREGLRQAYLNQHATELDDESCQWTRAHLGAYIRSGISRRDAGKVEDHLGDCRNCAAIYLELSEVNSNLGAILAPLLLGGVGAAYVSAATGAAAPAGLLGVLDRARDLVAAHSQVAAVVGVTSAVAIGGGGFLVWQDSQPPPVVSSELAGTGRPGDVSGSPRTPVPSGDASGPAQRARERSVSSGSPTVSGFTIAPPDTTVPVTAATPGPTQATSPGGTASSGVTAGPTSGPSSGQTTGPTSGTTTGSTSDATTGSTSDAAPGSTSGTTSDEAAGSTSGPTRNPTAGTTQDPGPTTKPTTKPSTTAATPTATTTATPAPTDGPTDGPPPTLAPRDLAVSVEVRALNARTAELVATVTGIPAGGSATVVVSGRLVNLQSTDARCVDAAVTTCSVTDSRPFAVLAIAANLEPRVTFTVTGGGAPDDDPADNSVTVTWD